MSRHRVRTAVPRLLGAAPAVPVTLGHAAPAVRLARQARALGLRAAVVDLAEVTGKPALMDAFARDLALPGWFGRNWDALYDCLTDLTATLVVVDHAREAAAADPQMWAAACSVLRDAARAGERHRAYVVVRTPHRQRPTGCP